MNLKQWEKKKQLIRQEILSCLGDCPKPKSSNAKILEKRIESNKIIEKFVLVNGLGDSVPGYFIRPKKEGKFPAILYFHCHGGNYTLGKNEIFKGFEGLIQPRLDEFIIRGYAVMAIDYYCFGERQPGQEFAPKSMPKESDELSAFKQMLWNGKTLWGMMVFDQSLALDYLCKRKEVIPDRIGTMGFSMGGTMAWWLPALDDRMKVSVSVCCLTRYADLIAAGGCHLHGIYYYVPGIRKKHDTEDVVSMVAPKPLLVLNGRTDQGSPMAGVIKISKEVKKIYQLYGKPGNYRNLIYDCGHQFTEPMWRESFAWLDKFLK